MSKSIKILAILGQVLFAWFYSSATNYCFASSCTARSYVAFLVISVVFVIFDLYFLKLYPRFKRIPIKLLLAIILFSPVLFFIGGIILNALTAKVLPVIIVGAVLVLISIALWIVLARGIVSQKLTEYLAIKSLYLLVLAVTFLIANLNFAISSYLKYKSPTNDVYITENKGIKSNFINYKFR